ncbi:hypothetical protein [Nocardia sp. NPDC004860]|uniref:hypothetical protein n=1 Tax=Nocardia sp. NPDC004860 TaxID=3154557 RepID=UPI0033A49C49
MTTTRPHIIDTAAGLVAELATICDRDIPARALVLLLVRPIATGHYLIDSTQCLAAVDGEDIRSVGYTDHEAWAFTTSQTAYNVVAVVVDAAAEGPRQNFRWHSNVIEKAAALLAERNTYFDAMYAATGTAPGSPVWSLDTAASLGEVPPILPVPDETRWALSRTVTVMPPF